MVLTPSYDNIAPLITFIVYLRGIDLSGAISSFKNHRISSNIRAHVFSEKLTGLKID